MLVLVSRLERREQYCAIASTRRVQRRGGDRTSKSLVITDVRDIESGSRVPRAITLRCEPLVGVPGRVGVAVEVNHDGIWIVYLYCCYRARNQGAAGIHNQNARECRERNANLA
jgi:hypothetical protein